MHQLHIEEIKSSCSCESISGGFDGIPINPSDSMLAGAIREIEKNADASFNLMQTSIVRKGYDSNVYCLIDETGTPWVLKEYSHLKNKSGLTVEQTFQIIQEYANDTQKLSHSANPLKLNLDFTIDNNLLSSYVSFVAHPEPFIADDNVYTISKSWVAGPSLWDLMVGDAPEKCLIYDRSSHRFLHTSFSEVSTCFMNPLQEICAWANIITGRNYEVVYRNIKPQLDIAKNEFILTVTDPANKISDPLKQEILTQKFPAIAKIANWS